MTLDHLYILKIPDLPYVLNPEDIAVWELYLVNEEKRYEKIRFQSSTEDGCYTFHNAEDGNGRPATVQFDFDNQRIVFGKGGAQCAEFDRFLPETLSKLFVRIEKDRIQFLATENNKRKKTLSTRS